MALSSSLRTPFTPSSSVTVPSPSITSDHSLTFSDAPHSSQCSVGTPSLNPPASLMIKVLFSKSYKKSKTEAKWLGQDHVWQVAEPTQFRNKAKALESPTSLPIFNFPWSYVWSSVLYAFFLLLLALQVLCLGVFINQFIFNLVFSLPPKLNLFEWQLAQNAWSTTLNSPYFILVLLSLSLSKIL